MDRVPAQIQDFEHWKLHESFFRYVGQEIVFQVEHTQVAGVLENVIVEFGGADFALKHFRSKLFSQVRE